MTSWKVSLIQFQKFMGSILQQTFFSRYEDVVNKTKKVFSFCAFKN